MFIIVNLGPSITTIILILIGVLQEFTFIVWGYHLGGAYEETEGQLKISQINIEFPLGASY
jgi:hypothetical protein